MRMHEPETLTALSAEFHALPERKRRAILATLPAGDRFRSTVMLREALPRPAESAPADKQTPACSDWLLERLRFRSGEEAGAERPWTMTHASWTALMEVATGLGIDPAPVAAPPAAAPSESLFDKLARLFERRPA
jgi:hypothetical protein